VRRALATIFKQPCQTPGKEQESEVSNEKKEIKVTDKRMFTPDGELREEYRVLAEKSTAAATEPAPAASAVSDIAPSRPVEPELL
jgi:hypothetical protein